MSQLKYWDGTAWVDAVIGAQGTTGSQGVGGSNGVQGTTGLQGIQGLIGLQGASGGGGAATPTVAGSLYGYSTTSTGTWPYSTGIGYQVFAEPTANNINYCTGVGYQAMKGGYENVGVGYQAAKNASLNSYSLTALGAYALRQNTDGTDNTAVGHSALYAVTTGWGNTAIGSGALIDNSGSTRNTAVGLDSLRSTTSLSANTNTAIGAYSGGTTFTNGANNTFVGYQADSAAAASSNTITLGNASITTLRCNTTSITSLSDARDKKEIENLNLGLDFVNELKPVQYVWDYRQPENPELDENGNPIVVGRVNVPDMGFIAQDLAALEDSLGLAEVLQLTMRDNPDRLEATQGRLIPILVKAIQELSAEVAALKAQNPSV